MFTTTIKKLSDALTYPVLFVVMLWVIFFIGRLAGLDLFRLGVLPRTSSGLTGILFYPLIHSNIGHLTSNTLPLLVMGITTFYFYRNSAFPMFFLVYFLSGIFVWIFARSNSYHIGASGIIYGFAAFLFFSGVFRKDVKSVAIALLVVFFYGSLVWGLLPLSVGVSWEGHLFGGLSGVLAAYVFRNSDPPERKYDWENEDEDEDYDPRKLKVDWRKDINDL